MTVADFYTKPLQGKIFRLFQNMILNLNDEDVQHIICTEKIAITEDHNTRNDRDKYDRPSHECVEKNFRIGKNDDECRALGSDEKGFVCTERSDTHNVIANKKPGLLI